MLLSLSLFCTIGKGNYGESLIWSFYGPYTGVMKVIQLQVVLYSRIVDVDSETITIQAVPYTVHGFCRWIMKATK